MGARLKRALKVTAQQAAARSATLPRQKLKPRPGHPPRPLIVPAADLARSRRAAPKVLAFPKRKPEPPPHAARRAAHDEAALQEMARRHLAYELKMLRETGSALRGNGIGPRSYQNAMLETFLIHYRNLLDFFYADKRRSLSHDVRAADYVADDRVWRRRRPRLDKESSENRERVNAQLAHLTYRRLKYPRRNWHDRRMLRQIEALLASFVAELPPRRRRWFQQALDRAA